MSLENFQQAAGLYQQYVEQMKQIDMRPKNIALSVIPIRPSVKKRKELFKLQEYADQLSAWYTEVIALPDKKKED